MEEPHVEVKANAYYLPEHSQPAAKRYSFGYTITISNHGSQSVQLMERHWLITDGIGRSQEVNGKGVIGEQPFIAPGDSYTYSSFCPLTTPYGYMQGHYTMRAQNGETFKAEVPMFVLGSPVKRDLN